MRLIVSSRLAVIAAAAFMTVMAFQDADCKPKKKSPSASDNPIIQFLKENGVDIGKKVVAIQVTGQEFTDNGPRAVMKLIALKDEPNLKRRFASREEEEAVKKNAAFIRGANKLSADVIKTIVASIVGGTIIKDGDTKKFADIQVFLEDGSSFNVFVGEDFSQIVFEKILNKPENPFSKEPVEKSIKTLSFTSLNLLKSAQVILETKVEK
jgi:hypothetical protein